MKGDVKTEKLVYITLRHVYRFKQAKFKHLKGKLLFKTGKP